MRTRFLASDCSTASATGGGGPVETLDFLRMTLPYLPPPNYPPFSENFLQSFDEIPFLDLSLEIDKPPIDDALSILFSDVLPHFVGGGGFARPRIDSIEEKHEETKIYCGKKVLDSSDFDRTEIEVTQCITSSNNGVEESIFVQFEIPEMDISFLPSKSGIYSQIECLHNLSEVSEAELTMDLPNLELVLHDPAEIQQSFYSVDNISVEYSMEQNADFLEDADSVQGKLYSYNINFPVFEVDVESMNVLGKIYSVDELLSFENIEKQQITQLDGVISNNNELLVSMESDLIKYISHDSMEILCPEDTMLTLQVDFLSIIELSHCQEYSTIQGNPDGYSIWTVDPILFDEFMFFDLDPYHFCEVFSYSAKEIEAEKCEYMFGETMNFRSFSQLVICHELTLMDDSFRSLPAPIFSDHGNTSSLHTLVEELLAQLDWQSSSASDGLYLDWRFLGGDDCESAKISSCWKMLWEIDTDRIDVNMNLGDDGGKLIFDFILSEGYSSEPDAKNYKEILNLTCNDTSVFHLSGKEDLSSLNNPGDGKRINDNNLLKTGVENVSMFSESMSSDLEFFLNARKYVIGRENIPADKSVTLSQMSTDDPAAANAAVVLQKWHVKTYKVQLPANILLLLDYLWKDFLATLENEKELDDIWNQYKASNDLTLLYLPIKKLKDHLQERIARSPNVDSNNDDIMVMAVLCAIKQMGFYLCYYGIQATYLYINKLSTRLECLKSRLSFLYNLIRDENKKAEKELTIIHPSISVVKEILQTKLSQSNSKFLIVSDQVFWWPLKRLLTSLKISCKELEHPLTPPFQQQENCEIMVTITDIMPHSDCCLISPQYVNSSFPFSEFNFILEYGGPNVSSIISSICAKPDGQPSLYFLKVELQESSIAEALSHGVNLHYGCLGKRDLDSASVQKESKTMLEVLLNTIPVMEPYRNESAEAVNEDQDFNMMSAHYVPMVLESKQNLSCKHFGSNAVIIVNTRNFNEEMVISRRSTYQRILEMEQEGAQVVERDIGLPVDVIVSPAVCLTWYDCKNIGKKASAPDEAFSCLPLCVESVAASILTSLSFAFSCCILIFEGECNFLSSIVDSSDELYAAAASLGIHIQLFCSYSHEMTEEIILSCINVAAKLTRGVCPKMSDSESLAESFLNAFPSINPLSAHAILSSDANLGKFLQMSIGSKSCALQKYQVPGESIGLLTVLSRYGELEDSKSGLTDCSSSLSVPDSENVQFKSASERKKPKYTHKLYDAGEPPIDLIHMDSQNLLLGDQHDLPELSVSCNPWLSGSTKISKSEEFSLSSNEKLPHYTQDFDDDMMKSFDTDIMKFIDKSSLHDFPLAKGLQISDEKEKALMSQIDFDCSPGWKSATTFKNKFSKQSLNATGILQGSSTGEVIDLEDIPAFRDNFFVANPSNISPTLLDIENHAATNSRMNKRPSCAANLPIFSSPTEIHADSGAWVSRNDKRKILREETKPHFDIINRNNTPMMRQKGFMEEDIVEKVPQSSYRQSFQEKGTPSFGGTQLSNALHSTQPQGSPWTIEFLNRIREKSRLRKQSVSYDLSSPSFGSSGNSSKVTKRKSPSILEFYKYEGGRTPQKIVEEKRLKRFSRPLSSAKTKKASAPCPSLTPVDKRARRTLSFSTSGSGGQSKLVWRDSNHQTTERRL